MTGGVIIIQGVPNGFAQKLMYPIHTFKNWVRTEGGCNNMSEALLRKSYVLYLIGILFIM